MKRLCPPLRPLLVGIALICASGTSPAVAADPAGQLVDGPRLLLHDTSTIFEAAILERDGGTEVSVRVVTRTPELGWKHTPSWSPEGSHLAYVAPICARLPGGCGPGAWVAGTDLYIADVRTGDSVLVRSLPHMAVSSLAWSPSGRQLAFDARKVLETGLVWYPGPTHSDVYVVNTDGTELRPVTVDGLSHGPVWSPDGSQVAFVSSRAGRSRIYVSPPETLALATQVSDHGLMYGTRDPAWSPDGRAIAYVAGRLSGGDEIWIARPDGSEQYRAVEEASWVSFDWSPDSRSLVYTQATETAHGWESGVYIQPLGGPPQFVILGEFPRWAPDGRYIALNEGNRYPYRNVVVIDLKDGSVNPIMSREQLSMDYRWTP